MSGNSTSPRWRFQEALRELYRLGQVTAQMLDGSRRARLEQNVETIQWVPDHEDGFVDPVCKARDGFINTLLQSNLDVGQQRHYFQIKDLITDIERVGDLTEDMADVLFVEWLRNLERFSDHADNLGVSVRRNCRTWDCDLI